MIKQSKTCGERGRTIRNPQSKIEAVSLVSWLLQACPSLTFNCGIRGYEKISTWGRGVPLRGHPGEIAANMN
jgi:hypothetical protein